MHAVEESVSPPPAGLDVVAPILELRQYMLYPGTRDAFIAHFDRNLVESQEEAGIRVIGQFADLGDPNRFVWLRGFADMASRQRALTAFYVDGEAWKVHGEAARSKIIDSTDALLLRPANPHSSFLLAPAGQRPIPGSVPPAGIVVAALHAFAGVVDPEFVALYEEKALPLLAETGARPLGRFVTEHEENTFPRLPVREGEAVFVSFFGFAGLEAYHAHMTTLARSTRWRGEIWPDLRPRLSSPPQVLRLAPTARSQLCG